VLIAGISPSDLSNASSGIRSYPFLLLLLNMASNTPIDLHAPAERDTILQVRRAKLKPMPGLQIESAIDKLLCDGPVWVGKLGLDSDEHDLTFHGGVDKAVHGCKCYEQLPNASSTLVHYASVSDNISRL